MMKNGILNLHFQIEISQISFEMFYLVEYFQNRKLDYRRLVNSFFSK